jgi:hypothetical protein
MYPVLEEFAGIRRVTDQRARMGPEPRKQRELLTSNNDVDRVDLDEAHLSDDSPEMPTVDSSSGARRS